MDDPLKAILLPDELESILHVLLYNGFHYLPNNCIDLSEFVARFFDDAQQKGDHFVSGEMKYNTMERGTLRMKGHQPIFFLREPLKPSRKSPRNAPNPQNPATSKLPSTAGEADVFSSPDPPADTGAPPEDAIHPIHFMICRLLGLFKAYYHVQKSTKTVTPKLSGIQEENVADRHAQALASFKLRKGKASRSTSNSDEDDPASYPAKAAQLESHEAFIDIFLESAYTDPWPENDKQPDQVDPNYRPKDDTLKRSHLHDGNFEMPSGKRPATGTHASRG